MNILVTGGAGFIGSHTIVELLNAGHNVVVMDNLSNSKITSLKRVEELTGRSVVFEKIDLLDTDGMDTLFTNHDIDAVIHFAGLKAVGESVEKPLFYYENNVTGTINLCNLMNKHGVKRMVFSSSATVYGNPSESLSPKHRNFLLQTRMGRQNSRLSIFSEICANLTLNGKCHF